MCETILLRHLDFERLLGGCARIGVVLHTIEPLLYRGVEGASNTLVPIKINGVNVCEAGNGKGDRSLYQVIR